MKPNNWENKPTGPRNPLFWFLPFCPLVPTVRITAGLHIYNTFYGAWTPGIAIWIFNLFYRITKGTWPPLFDKKEREK